MTAMEAKEILAKNWWMNNNPSFPHQDYEITMGEVVRETDETDYFPNSYIISALITKKSENQTVDSYEDFAVSKETGECQHAILFL